MTFLMKLGKINYTNIISSAFNIIFSTQLFFRRWFLEKKIISQELIISFLPKHPKC